MSIFALVMVLCAGLVSTCLASEPPIRYDDWLSNWKRSGHNVFVFYNASPVVVGLRASADEHHPLPSPVMVAVWPGKTVMVPSFTFRKSRKITTLEGMTTFESSPVPLAAIELCVMPKADGHWEALEKTQSDYAYLHNADLERDFARHAINNSSSGMIRILAENTELAVEDVVLDEATGKDAERRISGVEKKHSTLSNAIVWCAPGATIMLPETAVDSYFYVQLLATYTSSDGGIIDDPQSDTVVLQSEMIPWFPFNGSIDEAAWYATPTEDVTGRNGRMLADYVVKDEDYGLRGDKRLVIDSESYTFNYPKTVVE